MIIFRSWRKPNKKSPTSCVSWLKTEPDLMVAGTEAAEVEVTPTDGEEDDD